MPFRSWRRDMNELFRLSEVTKRGFRVEMEGLVTSSPCKVRRYSIQRHGAEPGTFGAP
jgi:hypothetical protein